MAGFLNVLVHGHTDLIGERVYAALGELDDIREFVAELTEHLDV